jgi:N,N'-diacetyllegionaminate synthase
MEHIYIIAEAGVNHNGRLDLALKLCDAAKGSGADAVKFQTWKTENLVTAGAEKAQYQKVNDGRSGSQFDMLKKLELPYDDFRKIKEYCEQTGIEFLSTPHDAESLAFLVSLGVEKLKIASGDIGNLPFLRQAGRTGKEIILSTGISAMDEIKMSVDALIQGGTLKDRLTLLHCTTEYPAPMEDVNLRAMLTIRDTFGLKTGYSDHTKGFEVSVAAAALGACVIEKHFTLDKNMEGPDHKASLDPEEFKAMAGYIRNIEKALGDGIKKPSAAELKNKSIVRKVIVAAAEIKAGEVFTELNLTVKRSGAGIPPMDWDNIIGKPAGRDFHKDEIIEN